MSDINDSNISPSFEQNTININQKHINLNEIKNNKIKLKEISIPIQESEQFQNRPVNMSFLKNCINYLDNLDKQISKPLHKFAPNFIVECIFYVFARLFNIHSVIFYLICVLVYSFIKYKNGYLAIIPICHVICGGIFTIVIKVIIRRPRPTIKVKKNFKLKENTHSMPSGDTLQSAIFATMIILYFKCYLRFFALLLIPATMLGRIFYNLHYLFDCIIGAILGIFISITTNYIINIIKNKYFF